LGLTNVAFLESRFDTQVNARFANILLRNSSGVSPVVLQTPAAYTVRDFAKHKSSIGLGELFGLCAYSIPAAAPAFVGCFQSAVVNGDRSPRNFQFNC
jgi:hypothetical protein